MIDISGIKVLLDFDLNRYSLGLKNNEKRVFSIIYFNGNLNIVLFTYVSYRFMNILTKVLVQVTVWFLRTTPQTSPTSLTRRDEDVATLHQRDLLRVDWRTKKGQDRQLTWPLMMRSSQGTLLPQWIYFQQGQYTDTWIIAYLLEYLLNFKCCPFINYYAYNWTQFFNVYLVIMRSINLL